MDKKFDNKDVRGAVWLSDKVTKTGGQIFTGNVDGKPIIGFGNKVNTPDGEKFVINFKIGKELDNDKKNVKVSSNPF